MMRVKLGRTGPNVLAVIVVMATLSSGLTSCGAERSPQAFCKVYDEEKAAYIAKYNERNDQVQALEESDSLAAFMVAGGSIFEALGDIVIIFDKLDKVAPDDIEPDVAAIRDALKKQNESAKDSYNDPIGSLLGGLVSGLTTSGSWTRVGDYVTENCES